MIAVDAAVTRVLASGGVDEVSLDLGLVTFADSTTLAWLVRASGRIRANGAGRAASEALRG